MKGISELIACVAIVGLCVWMGHTRDFHRHHDDAYHRSAQDAYRALEQVKADVDGGVSRDAYWKDFAAAQKAVDRLGNSGEQSAACLRRTVFIYDFAGKLQDGVNNAPSEAERRRRRESMDRLREGETAAFSLAQARDALNAGQ